MPRIAAWLSPLLLFLPVTAATAQAPANDTPLPTVDLIAPVPPPEIPFALDAAASQEMPTQLNITNIGGGPIEFIPNQQVRYAGPGVKIIGDNGMEIFADRALIDFKAETATLEGNVSIYQGNLMQRGNRAVYHYTRKHLDASDLRASIDPLLLEAGRFHTEDDHGRTIYVGTDAGVTTHDVENPNYWLRAGRTTIYPDEKVVFNDLHLFIGNTPVFWLPYFSQPLNPKLGYHFIPGSRSNWGPYLLNTYGLMLGGKTDPVTGENTDAWLLSRSHLDLRARRGIGFGIDLTDVRLDAPDEISGLSLYYLNDLNPDTSRSGIPRDFVNEDRFKLELKHRIVPHLPGDDAEWRFDSNLTWLSDRHYLEDFDTTRYRIDPQPDNTLGVYRRDETSLLSLFTRFRINDFYRADTRLPEISYDRARTSFAGTRILHEGTTSFGVIGEEPSDPTRSAIIDPLMGLTLSDPEARRLLDQLSGYERRLAANLLALPLGDARRDAIRTQLVDSGYARFHTYQEWSLPFLIGDFLSFSPQAGLGYSRYDFVEGPLDGFDRTQFHAGAETSVKFSKEMSDLRNSRWGIDGLMHVVQPYAAWSVISTNDYEAGEPNIDRLTPTTRPRPIDPLRFTAVDDLQSWNIVRFGAHNRLLTRRDGQAFEWLHLDSYMDAFVEDPEGNRNVSNLYNDITWQPLPWLGLELETQIPMGSSKTSFSEFNSRLHFLPTDRFEFSLGFRWLDGHPVLIDSQRFDVQTYTRLTENWGFGMRHILELDDNTLELQQYTFHRDLGNWVAGAGLSFRDNRVKDEYGVVLSLTLKDFSSVSLPFKLDAE